jgi:Domain of unknown function (DUF4349)
MTSSSDLIHELRATRPSAPTALRARVREIAAQEPAPSSWTSLRLHLPLRRGLVIAVPAAAALALATAGVLGLARSDNPTALHEQAVDKSVSGELAPTTTPGVSTGSAATILGAAQGSQGAPTRDSATSRAQRVSATMTLEVRNSDAVSRAAQGALDLTRSLGGYVVSSSVATGEEGSASLTVRVPVARVQEAIAGLSALGRIVSQQVTIDDLQATLDELQKREASVRGQIARIRARLESESLDPETEAVLRAKLQTLRAELVQLRTGIDSTNAEARMSTIQVAVVTPGASGAVPPTSRIDRTIDEALNVLAWEGIVLLGLLIVLAPFALVGVAAWLARRLYRRHEEERLLAT